MTTPITDRDPGDEREEHLMVHVAVHVAVLEWWARYFDDETSKEDHHPQSYVGDISFSEGWVSSNLRDAAKALRAALDERSERYTLEEVAQWIEERAAFFASPSQREAVEVVVAGLRALTDREETP